jgi:flagellar biosynthesis protein FlhB
MADDSNSGEKTEEPTPERLRKLREEGNVAKSQDVVSSISFLACFVVIVATLGFATDSITNLFSFALRLMNSKEELNVLIMGILLEAVWTMFKACAPVLLCAFVMGILLNVAQIGFLFTTKPITPDFKRLNPVTGFKNLINKKKLVELLKNIIKFIIISYVAYHAINENIRDLILLIRVDLISALGVIGHVIWQLVMQISIAFIIIAAADAFYQRKRYTKENMMTKHDIKQEYKQMEGDPEIKAQRKQMHREMGEGGGGNVKKADVVVRNPDHIAIAIKYNRDSDNPHETPEVIAKGHRIWAEKIIEEAERHNIPIVRNVPLAHALDKVKVGNQIPEELFDAVAEILNFVYNLKKEQDEKGKFLNQRKKKKEEGKK